jgi:hypothetical protein
MDIIFIFKVKHQFDRYYQNPKCPHLDSSHTPHFNHIDPCIPVKENTVDPVIMFGNQTHSQKDVQIFCRVHYPNRAGHLLLIIQSIHFHSIFHITTDKRIFQDKKKIDIFYKQYSYIEWKRIRKI